MFALLNNEFCECDIYGLFIFVISEPNVVPDSGEIIDRRFLAFVERLNEIWGIT